MLEQMNMCIKGKNSGTHGNRAPVICKLCICELRAQAMRDERSAVEGPISTPTQQSRHRGKGEKYNLCPDAESLSVAA